MSFRLSHIHDYDRFLAIDMGSYRTRAALYELGEGSLTSGPTVTIRQNKKNFHMGAISDMQGVALTLDRALHEASRKSDNIPDDVIIGFSPEVCIYDTITTQYIRSDRDAPISMQEIDTMIHKIEYDSHQRAREKAKHQYALYNDDIRLLSSTLTSIYIDEKRIGSPIGFEGKVIRITVLNIFCTSTEFNLIRSIVSSLSKRIISLIPLPLLLPKAIEASEYTHDHNVYLDIGAMHTTVLLENENQILHFETFLFGSKMLFDMLLTELPDTPVIEMEAAISGSVPPSEHTQIYTRAIGEYLDYILDVFFSVIASHSSPLQISNIILAGGIFDSIWIGEVFREKSQKMYEKKYRILKIGDLLGVSGESYTTHALALMARELLLVKKDPVIRILRYVLYNYE